MRNTRPDPYAELGEGDWWYPERLDPDGGGPVLSEDQIGRFRHDGFVVVSGLWPDDLIERAAAEARDLHPPDVVATAVESGDRRRDFSEMPWTQAGEAAQVGD